MPFKAYTKIDIVSKEFGGVITLPKGSIVDLYEEEEAMIYACSNNLEKTIIFINNQKEKYNDILRYYTFYEYNNSKRVAMLIPKIFEKITNEDVIKALENKKVKTKYTEYEIYDIEIMKCLSLLNIGEGSKKTIQFKLADKEGNVIKNDYYIKDSFTYEKEKDELKGCIYGEHTTRGKEIIVDCDEHSANIILKAIHMKAFKIKYVGNEDNDGLFKDEIIFEGSEDKQDSVEKEILSDSININYKYNDFVLFIMSVIIIIFIIIGLFLIK